MFDVVMREQRIWAIYDKRYQEKVDITDGTGRFGWLSYTKKLQKLQEQKKPEFLPYEEQYSGFDQCVSESVLKCSEFQTIVSVEQQDERVVLDLQCASDEVSAVGIFLPFNFISRKNGNWRQQFTISSPYHTLDGKHFLYYLCRPDGNHLVCVVENEIAGFRVNYSPYLCGHFIRGIEFLSNFDQVYERKRMPDNQVKVHIAAVPDYREALRVACEIWDMPALYYEQSSVLKGQAFTFETIGEWDCIEVITPSGKRVMSDVCYTDTDEYGIYQAIPYRDNKAGMGCQFFVHDDFLEMYRRACNAICQDRTQEIGQADDGSTLYKPPFLAYRGYEDYNLCEHAMWCWALIGFMRLSEATDRYQKDVENALKLMLNQKGVRLERMTYDRDNHYTTYGDNRIQEAYNGVNILLSAYRLWKDERLMEFAIRVLEERLSCDMSEEGGLFRHGSDGVTAEVADYTTVTGMIIPIVDMAILLKEKNDTRSQQFEDIAIRVADYVVKRGLTFPTEGGAHPEVYAEVEEGSISCSALTVLYVAARLCNKKEYIDFAKKIFQIHDAFTVYTPHPVMFRSSLRWWETIWEGEADGPAVCYGHAWSIWRAEAQYWYGILTGDEARLLDSYNGFLSNLAKEDEEGNMYTIYQYEPISSGALIENGCDVDYSDREGFPHAKDVTLSRYVFARAKDTWFETVAVLKGHVLGATVKDGILIPYVPNVRRLYIGDVAGDICIQTKDAFEIIGNRNGNEVRRI